MGSSALPLIIFLMSFTHSEQNQYTGPVQPQKGPGTSYETGPSTDGSQGPNLPEAGTSAETERPKPVVGVSPDQRVFIGETVTLTCGIQTGGNIQWTYSWIKDGNPYYQYYPHTKPSTAELSFRADSVSVSGKYSCRGERSDISDAVTLTVSAVPTPTVSVTPDRTVFTGETVSITCHIVSGHGDWKFVWYKDIHSELKLSDHYTADRGTLTIRGAAGSDQGQYWCKGQIRSVSTQTSSSVYLYVNALPTSTLYVTPDSPVFTGETVNLQCVIESDHRDWTFEWYKDRNRVKLQSDGHYTVNRDTLTIRGAAESDQGQYWCRGQRSGIPNSSQSSSAVDLSVKERPKPVVKVRPDQRVFIGETVKLTCDIQTGGNIQWIKYSWIKDGDTHYQYYPQTKSSTVEWNFKADNVYYSGQYSCRGERSDSQTSHISDAVTLTVSALPTSKVTVTPASAVFIGETVDLTCVIESRHSDWTYDWYKDTHRNSVLQTSKFQTLTITKVTWSDEGQYWCRGQRSRRPNSSQSSSAVSLSVKALPTSKVTVTPASAVFIGETVGLTCVIEPRHSDWRYDWYKDTHSNSVLQTSKLQTLTITKATWSDQGQYWCRGQRSGRPNSSQSSSAVSLSVKALPRPTVTVTPAIAVFTGETVNLTCVIESYSFWTYEWYSDSNSVKLQSDGHYSINRDNLTIRGAAESDQGQYWCEGRRSRRPNSSQLSSAVSLNVTHLKPKPELRSDTAGAILTGNTVTLTCNTDLSTGWDFYWYKNTQESEIKKTRTNSYSMKIDSVSDGGQYWCRAGRGEPVYYTQYSDELTLSVTESPKAVMTVRPDERVFRGETVTLRCDIKWGGNTEWTYRWQIDTQQTADKPINPCTRPDCCTSGTTQQHYRTAVSRCSAQELKISCVEVFHRGNYSCTGQMNTQSSQRSDAVALIVSSDEAQAAVRVSPQPWITEGHSVTLICEVPGSSTGWTFSWFRDANHLSDSSRGAGGSYTLSPAALQHTGVYTCRAERGEPAYSSQNSSTQPLWVTGVSASVRLVLRPSRSQHFSSDTLSLSCDSGWTVRRYTHTNTQDCSAQTGSTCGIQSLSTSDTGVYWCESESGEKRHPLNITVHDGAVILESSADPVIEGETLTLHCLHRSTIPSILTASFYKDGSLIQNQTTGEMSIPTVSKSDEGFYYCKTKSGESPHSWISVRGSSSSLLIIGVSVGLTVFLLLLILLVLLLRHKKKKDPHCGVQPTLVSNPSGESQTDNLTLQSGSDHIYDDVSTVNNKDEEPVADVTYSEVTLKKNIPMNEDGNIPGQSNTMYAEVGTKAKKPKRKDINAAGPSDMTYAVISKKDKKKTTGKGAGISDVLIEMKSKEKHGGMSSKSGDTLYSELKLNTDGDTDTGATYAQVLSKKKKKTRL